jgi:AcrR family transcriptional regulator
MIIARERILQAAHRLMSSYGVRSITMDDLAADLGISKKTIYKYFDDKDAIVEEVVQMVLADNRISFEQDLKKADNAVHEMTLCLNRLVDMLESMNPSVLFDLRKYHPAAYAAIQRHQYEFLYDKMKANVMRGIREGYYRMEIKPDIIARYRVESILLPFNPEFSKATRSSLAELESEILQHYLFGLVTPSGYKVVQKYLKKKSSLNHK